MPKKLGKWGTGPQEYVPAGNGDASGEYADDNGNNIHYFAKFAQPLPNSFNINKTTLPKKTGSSNTKNKKADKATKIKDTLEQFNKNTVKGKDNAYKDINAVDLINGYKNGKYLYAIDKVLDQLGFNGLPQVVDKDVFDQACKESSFAAVRGIGATNQAILDAYVDQLYNGDFYVNCSQGGHQYGQGMYCAADYSGVLSKQSISEAEYYAKGNGSVGKVVKLTLAKDAKIVKHKDLIAEFDKKIKSDPNAVEFLAKSICMKSGIDYDILDQSGKDFLNHEVEYRFNGDVKLHTKLKKTETDAIKNEYIKNSFITYYSLAKSIKQASIKFKDGLDANKNPYNYGGNVQVSNACDSMGVDDGVLAAVMGYDAINSEGHGPSASYTVILNRTKCLFLKE